MTIMNRLCHNTTGIQTKLVLWTLVRFLLGLCIGVFFHYLLYRISLPVQPFIYAAF